MRNFIQIIVKISAEKIVCRFLSSSTKHPFLKAQNIMHEDDYISNTKKEEQIESLYFPGGK